MPSSLILCPAYDKHDRACYAGSEIKRPYPRALRIGSALRNLALSDGTEIDWHLWDGERPAVC